ncbi:hypothetical protein Tco_0715353 [Tanacetum coccineum]
MLSPQGALRHGKPSNFNYICLVHSYNPLLTIPHKEPVQNPETSTKKSKIQIGKYQTYPISGGKKNPFSGKNPKKKNPKERRKPVNLDPNSPNPNSYQSKLPYPERMKVRENDKPSAQHSRFLKMFKQLCLEIGLKDALVEMPKFNKWLNDPSPSFYFVKTSDNFEKFADELAPLDLLPPVTSDQEPEQNESAITFSPWSDPTAPKIRAVEPLTLPCEE